MPHYDFDVITGDSTPERPVALRQPNQRPSDPPAVAPARPAAPEMPDPPRARHA